MSTTTDSQAELSWTGSSRFLIAGLLTNPIETDFTEELGFQSLSVEYSIGLPRTQTTTKAASESIVEGNFYKSSTELYIRTLAPSPPMAIGGSILISFASFNVTKPTTISIYHELTGTLLDKDKFKLQLLRMDDERDIFNLNGSPLTTRTEIHLEPGSYRFSENSVLFGLEQSAPGSRLITSTVSITVVPAPAPAALLLLTGSAIITRRRR